MLRAVIVDDNPEDREHLADLLRDAGIGDIQDFMDAKAAIAHIEAHEVELVFLDYKLEADLGIAHIARIRTIRPEARIFVITGLSRPGLEAALAKIGVPLLAKDEFLGEMLRRQLEPAVKPLAAQHPSKA